ncbi:DUF6973 domain-containing protein [Sphingomonas sp. 37zxx]|uniref:DUF6973 domain-containing protein n=1 Tax=Sphingomonas sp. 37zxx TaxID=1550073 RepID=UPI003FA6D8D4
MAAVLHLAPPQNNQCPAVSPGNIGNRTEVGNAMTRPGWQVINAKRAADISSSRAAANFPASQLWNGRGDAWRHFRWNFSMAQSMGSRAASGLILTFASRLRHALAANVKIIKSTRIT